MKNLFTVANKVKDSLAQGTINAMEIVQKVEIKPVNAREVKESVITNCSKAKNKVVDKGIEKLNTIKQKEAEREAARKVVEILKHVDLDELMIALNKEVK